MKKVKQSKPSGKYPALYYQEGNDKFRGYERIRIIYPDGTSEFRDDVMCLYKPGVVEAVKPCWSNGVKRTFDAQVRAMHKYDVTQGFPPAVFLGDIK